MSEPEAAHRGRGRRPFEDVRADVIAAAAAVLAEDGFPGFTVQKVIRRSGVSSATVHRHWSSRGALALDGYLRLADDSMPVRDTGDIRSDLRRTMVDFVNATTTSSTGTILTHLIAAAQTDPELAAQFDQRTFGPRRVGALALLAAARERGQIRQDADLELTVDLVWGPCYLRLLLPNLTAGLTEAFAVSVVDAVLPLVLTEK